MGLRLDERTKVIESKKLREMDIILVHIKGNACPYQVWSVEGELMYGTFKRSNIEDIALSIKRAYNAGFDVGTKVGRNTLQHEIKSLLFPKESE